MNHKLHKPINHKLHKPNNDKLIAYCFKIAFDDIQNSMKTVAF